MDYYELYFKTQTTEDYQQDLLINALGEIGFDTFEELDNGVKAYISVDEFDQVKLEDQLVGFRNMFSFSYEANLVRHKNWNELWESNFEPIAIKDKLFVRATFHQPREGFPYEIVIDPKMAFGTGHHQTTSMMLELLLENDVAGKKVLDMGCGTGILAIMAAKLGAGFVTAIDYDPTCYESTLENTRLNRVENIAVLCGSKEMIPDEQFDIILANINRNILMDQMERYALALKPGGEIYLSGFYEIPDLAIITAEALKYGLKYVYHKNNADWAAAKVVSYHN
jgi:ribosomal protein L11 methyltransferase